jgi:hypothetical protein
MHNQWDLSQEQLVREKALYQYLSAFEHGDFESMGTILQKAVQDPLLEAMILEAHEYYQAEEQLTLRGEEREKILQMVLEHLPSGIWEEQDEMAIPLLTVADVIAKMQQDRALTGSIKQEIQMISEQMPSPQHPLPVTLNLKNIYHLFEQLGLSVSTRVQKLFREKAIFLSMAREQGMAHLAATRRQQRQRKQERKEGKES